jgi:hypothetical protein
MAVLAVKLVLLSKREFKHQPGHVKQGRGCVVQSQLLHAQLIPWRPNPPAQSAHHMHEGNSNTPGALVELANMARFSIHILPCRHCGLVAVMIQFADGSFAS